MAIATAQYTIRDENDISIGSTAPSSPVQDQLWLDTSTTPSVLKRYKGTTWEVINDIQVGGNNLIRNSAFDNGLNFWVNASGGLSYNAEGSDNALLGKKYLWMENLSTTEKFIYQYGIRLKPSTKYTFSCFCHNDMAGNLASMDIFVLGQINLTDTTGYAYVHGITGVGNTSSNWVKKTLTFTTASNEIQCCIRIDNNGSTSGRSRIGLLKLEEGSVSTAWSAHAEEIYTTSTVIDKDGLTVNNGALKVKNNAGEIVLSGDSSGNLYLQNGLTVGGTTSGNINIKNASDDNIFVANSNGIVIKDGNLTMSNSSISSDGNMTYSGDKYEATYGGTGLDFFNEIYGGLYPKHYNTKYAHDMFEIFINEFGTNADNRYTLTGTPSQLNLSRWTPTFINPTVKENVTITTKEMIVDGYSTPQTLTGPATLLSTSKLQGGLLEIKALSKPTVLIRDMEGTIEGEQGRIVFVGNYADQGVQLRYNAFDSTRPPYGLHLENAQGYNTQPSNKPYMYVDGVIYAGTSIKFPTTGGDEITTNGGLLLLNGQEIQQKALTRSDGYALYTDGTTDLNDLITTGFHQFGATAPLNAPPANQTYAIMQVIGRNTSSVSQIYMPHNGAAIYYRVKNSNGWQAWTEIPLLTDFGSSKATSGYQKLPGGVIFQWGRVSVTPVSGTTISQTVTLPIAFPTACQSVTVNPLTGDPSGIQTCATTYTASNFALYTKRNNSNVLSVAWMAMGY